MYHNAATNISQSNQQWVQDITNQNIANNEAHFRSSLQLNNNLVTGSVGNVQNAIGYSDLLRGQVIQNSAANLQLEDAITKDAIKSTNKLSVLADYINDKLPPSP
jgi:exosome complex RNA-binding protein Csl4